MPAFTRRLSSECPADIITVSVLDLVPIAAVIAFEILIIIQFPLCSARHASKLGPMQAILLKFDR
jgi:hypothetical protein